MIASLPIDIIELIYSFVDDYEKKHKKNMKIILKQVKKVGVSFKPNQMIKKLNECTYKTHDYYVVKGCRMIDFNRLKYEFHYEGFRSHYHYKKAYHSLFKEKLEYDFLRMYLPYNIGLIGDSEYIMWNRDYVVIGTDGCKNDIRPQTTFLFNDGTTIWHGTKREKEECFKDIVNKFVKLTKGRKCVNELCYHSLWLMNLPLNY